MEKRSARDLTREWFDRVWNQLDRSTVADLMHENCEILGLGRRVVGPEGFLAIYDSFTGAFDQIRVEIVDLVEEADEVAGHARFAARHRGSERQVDMMFSFAGRFADGKLIWIRNVVDYTSLLAQLNLFDPKRIDVVFESTRDAAEI